MSKTFTLEDLNDVYRILEDAHCPYDYETHCNLVKTAFTGVDLAAGKDRTVIVQTVFHRRDIYEVLGMNGVKTDCKYYSGNPLLLCAVNNNCEGCVDYYPE